MTIGTIGDARSPKIDHSADTATSSKSIENNPFLTTLSNVTNGKRATIRGDFGMAETRPWTAPSHWEKFDDESVETEIENFWTAATGDQDFDFEADLLGAVSTAPVNPKSEEDASISGAVAGVRDEDPPIDGAEKTALLAATDALIKERLKGDLVFDEIEKQIDALPDPGEADPPDNDVREPAAQDAAQKRLAINPPAGPAQDPEVGPTGTAGAESIVAAKATENSSCLDQFRTKALIYLFSQGGKVQAPLLAVAYTKSPNPYAKLTVLHFAVAFKASCDSVKSRDIPQKEKAKLLAELKAVAKDYLDLIKKEGLGEKSPFGAFYLGQKTVRRERVNLEKKLIQVIGADTSAGRGKLHDHMWSREVTPYVQNFLDEKYAGEANDVNRGFVQGSVGGQSLKAMNSILDAVEEHSEQNGTSMCSIAGMLELAALWPALMCDFIEPKKAPAANAVKPEEEEAAVLPESPDANGGPSLPAPILKPGSKQVVPPPLPPRPSTGSASVPGPAMPAPGGGQAPVPQIINNYITNSYDHSVTKNVDKSINIRDSYNESVSSSDSADIGSGEEHTFNLRSDSGSAADRNHGENDDVESLDGSEAGSISFENDEGHDEVDSPAKEEEIDNVGRFGSALDSEPSLTDRIRFDARSNSIVFPVRRSSVSASPDPDDSISNSVSEFARKREMFEDRIAGNSGKGNSIQLAAPKQFSMPEDQVPAMKSVEISRREIEAGIKERASLQLLNERFIREREEKKAEPTSPLNLTWGRELEYLRTGRPREYPFDSRRYE